MGDWNGNLIWILLLSALMFVVSIVVARLWIVHMPPDYLTMDRSQQRRLFDRRPLVRVVWWFVRNVLGLLIMSAGAIMLFTPGQGILFILLGLMLLDFPGKYPLLRRLLGRRGVLKMINRVRRQANRPPLEYPGASRTGT